MVYPAKQLPSILPSSSSVTSDIHSGLVHILDQHLKDNDTALLLFYAPWCVHSSRAAKILLAVADRLKGEVQGGNCNMRMSILSRQLQLYYITDTSSGACLCHRLLGARRVMSVGESWPDLPTSGSRSPTSAGEAVVPWTIVS